METAALASQLSVQSTTGRKQQPPPQDAATSLYWNNYVDNEGILMYLWKASDFQRPRALICESDIPASAA